MAAVSCPCVFCWPRKAIENEGGQPIFEVNVQVIPNLWNVSQNDQTVHSCASLLSCYLCQLTWWVRHLKKIKCTHKIKCRGLTHFIFILFLFFYFKRGSCPPILFLYAGRGSKHCFFRALFWFFGSSGRVDPAKPGSFSQFGVFFGRVPLKNKVLPPDTVGFDGSSRDSWCYAWGSWGFPGDVWIWELDWVRPGVWFFRAIPCKTINKFICINQYMQFAAFIISSLSLIAFIEPCFRQHFKHWQTQLRVPN